LRHMLNYMESRSSVWWERCVAKVGSSFVRSFVERVSFTTRWAIGGFGKKNE